MASCDWKKIKTANDAKAMFRHCDKDERIRRNHTNGDIDKSRTHLNMQLGAFKEGYKAVCKEYNDHITALDMMKGANKRKDRVSLIGWSIPCPEGMSDSEAASWFVDVYAQLIQIYGDNIIGGAIHFDEVHEYTDPTNNKIRVSRPHMHIYCVPDIDGRLNARDFVTRESMVVMNNNLETLTRLKYPGYKFLTGEKRKSRKSVEQLKQESDQAAVKVEAERKAAELLIKAKDRADQIESDAILRAEKEEERLDKIREKIQQEEERLEQIKSEADEKLNEYDKTARAVQERVNAILTDANRKAEEILAEAVKTQQRANESVTAANKIIDTLNETIQFKAQDDITKAIMKHCVRHYTDDNGIRHTISADDYAEQLRRSEVTITQQRAKQAIANLNAENERNVPESGYSKW